MKINQLRCFNKVCEYKNFTKASKDLFVSQPAISANIKKLENEMGVKLFERKNNKIFMTEEAEFLLPKVNAILKQIDDLSNQIHSLNDNLIINVGVPPMIGELIFPQIFYNFKKNNPNIDLNIIECGSKKLLNIVKDDTVEVGFGIMRENIDSDMETFNILRTQIVFATNRKHQIANLDKINFSLLKNERLIVMKDDSYQNTKIKKSFSEIGVEPKIVLFSNQLNTIKMLLSNGDVGAFLIKEIVDNDPVLIGIPFEKPININIRLAWKKDKINEKKIKHFIEFIKDIDL